ncbi:cyclic nucleotide-binding domain-containing protein [Streptomyces sp. NPDC048566]|uniref:cyclic nucleotide-binding domain-containing protein n=1 Tax=Streptomyces sp. NPDC048566 TaxID=3365569 RepID=UPI003711DD75
MTAAPAPAMEPEHRARLMCLAREVSFPAGTPLFDEGGRADRFWVVRTGTVTLDVHVPGRRPTVLDTLGPGDLVGWSWRFPPWIWQAGAASVTPVRAWEFDAASVRARCAADPEFGRGIGLWVGRVVALRLHAARLRLLDLYAADGGGGRL